MFVPLTRNYLNDVTDLRSIFSSEAQMLELNMEELNSGVISL